MKISTSIEPFYRMNDINKILRELKHAGFEAYDYSMFEYCKSLYILDDDNFEEKAKAIRKYADEVGIYCNQSHAPFPTWLKDNPEYNAKMFPKLIKALEVTSILGGKVCVIHPCNDASAEENATFYNSLLPYAKKYNVQIGLENMWNWDQEAVTAACSHHEDFLAHMVLLDRDWFVANLDIGHAEMKSLGTSSYDMIYTLKDYLQALHIHDNDLVYDNHAIPFTMQINFIEICAALKAIDYQGDITLEVNLLKNMPMELYPSMMKFLADIANKLRYNVLK